MGEILHCELEDSISTRSIKYFTRAFTTVMKVAKPFVTESVQVSGLENILEEDGTFKEGPFIWLPKHESWNDIVNIATIWYDIGKPIVKVPSRRNILKAKIPSKILAWILSPIAFEVYRTWLGEGKTEEERKQMRLINKERLMKVRNHFYKGRHSAVFPEGTTKSDGSISKIKAGAYNLCKIEKNDGRLDLIQCVPVGNTYDFMAGDRPLGRKRSLVFFNIGEIFLYEPVEREDDESAEEYVRRDIAHFGQRILDCLMNLNTYTTSQLAGEYVMRLAREDNPSVNCMELDSVVKRRVEELKGIDGLIFDEALLSDKGRKKRVTHFYDELVRLGYVDDDGHIDSEQVLATPEDEDYKKGNILMYSVNRLLDICEARPAVAEVLRKDIITTIR